MNPAAVLDLAVTQSPLLTWVVGPLLIVSVEELESARAGIVPVRRSRARSYLDSLGQARKRK